MKQSISPSPPFVNQRGSGGGRVGCNILHYILEKRYMKAVIKKNRAGTLRARGKWGNPLKKIARRGGGNQRYFSRQLQHREKGGELEYTPIV